MRTVLWRALALGGALLLAGCDCGSKKTSGCDAGFSLVGGTCQPIAMTCDTDAGTLGAMCVVEHRVCATNGGVHCGDCVSGYQDFGGDCEVPITCAQLACDAANEACSDTPNGHCTDCLAGFTRDGGSGACHTPLGCSDIHCPAGQSCTVPPGVGDAYCSDGCGATSIGDDAGLCHACPACTDSAVGENGPYLGGLSGEGKCICQTLPGYFWEEGQFPGVKPCDADHDGWVRESAKLALESSNPAVQTNARCTLRQIGSVTLENERGQTLAVPVATASLYETDRNDDSVALAQAISVGKLPAAYGDGGRTLTAAELNSFTKYCTDTQADFNENGLADVSEWQANPDTTAIKATFKPYAPFLYFAELDDGWFEPGADGGVGTWRVKERSRLTGADPGQSVGFADQPDAGDYWRQCDRQVDSTYAQTAQNGAAQQNFDFARFGADDAGWSGMNHPSQFKCVVAVSQNQSGDPTNFLTVAAMQSLGLNANACVTTGPPQPPPVGVPPENPSSAAFACSTLAPSQLVNGQVLWATAGYVPYYSEGGYARGCVSECVEYPNRCPGYDPSASINPSSCGVQPGDYGKLVCTCDPRFSGTECDTGCAGDPTQSFSVSNLFVGPEFVTGDGGIQASPDGYWMCAKPSSTAYADAGQPYLGDLLGDPDSGYTILGEIPVMRSTAEASCEGDCDGGTGYAVR